MKHWKGASLVLALLLLLSSCGTAPNDAAQDQATAEADIVELTLRDDALTINDMPAGEAPESGVYTGNDIIYYEEGQDFTYGEGSDADAHSAALAAEHTVVHIGEPGTYRLSGTMRKGQIAVDLGEDAKDDPEAVVTLILNGIDITCEVAPAILFYQVYECGSTDVETASPEVDTSAAGANVIIADGTTNIVNGSYEARIYQPDSVQVNDAGTEVEDAKKLHKYDGAFYSRMSMNVSGGPENSGTLTIHAENEGLDSELHLTINGGIIRIHSGNDGINTNEDGVSVTTINGGELSICVTGETGEGDGIDSNGWLVINGGVVTAQAYAFSGDAGIDSDMGIHLNGGTVIAAGHMLDPIEEGGQNYAVFTFAEPQSGPEPLSLKDESGTSVFDLSLSNAYSILLYSSPSLVEGSYTLWSDGVQMTGQRGGMMAAPAMPGTMPGGTLPDVRPEGQAPDGMTPPEMPEGTTPPEWGESPPDGMERPEGAAPPDGQADGPWKPCHGMNATPQEETTTFEIMGAGNYFQGISHIE